VSRYDDVVFRGGPGFRCIGGPFNGRVVQLPSEWGGVLRYQTPEPAELAERRGGAALSAGARTLEPMRTLEGLYLIGKIARSPRPWRPYWVVHHVLLHEPLDRRFRRYAEARARGRPDPRERRRTLDVLWRATRP
jgi:hypothetical protein